MLKRIYILVLFTGLLAGCSSSPEANEPLRLRVLTYNIHHGRGADGEINLERIAAVINRAKPDLVALQEVDVKTRRSGGIDQAATLSRLTGMSCFFAEAMPFQGGGYGNAVLARVGIDFTLAAPLEGGPGTELRVNAVARLAEKSPDNKIIYLNSTHLSHESEQARLKQMEDLLWPIPMSAPPFRVILAGDFNFTPGSKPYNVLIDKGWVDTAAVFGDPKPTVPANKPTRRIDYVFVRPAERWRVINVQVLDEPIASDHAPVVVELEYVLP